MEQKEKNVYSQTLQCKFIVMKNREANLRLLFCLTKLFYKICLKLKFEIKDV